jgi:hypothetical protein
LASGRVFIRIGGKLHYLWRAVDDEGEVLDVTEAAQPQLWTFSDRLLVLA